MKKLMLLTAAATVVMSSAAFAQATVSPNGSTRIPSVDSYRVTADPVEYRILDSLANAFSYYSGNQMPFVYDPLLNLLATIKRGNPAQTGNTLWIWESNDLGVTWSGPLGPLHDPAATGSGPARYPSMLANPTHSTNPAEYFHYYTAPILIEGAFGGRVSGLINQSGDDVIAAYSNAALGTDKWGSSTVSVETQDGGAIVSIGTTNGNAIAMSRMDLNTGVVTESIIVSSDNFSDPGTPGSYTAVPGGIGRDETGKIFAVIWARTPTFDQGTGRDMPMPYMISSTDGGLTWTAPEMLPASTLYNYASNELGANPDSVITSYSPIGFTVTGANRFSVAFGLYDSDRSKTETASHFVEARYNNGTWNMRQIAVISGSWLDLEELNADPPDEQVDNEMQLVRTADGTKVVAKWVELFNYYFTEDIDGDGDAPDTMMTSDVMMSVRTIAGGEWSEPVNVTNTAIVDRLTWIPANLLPNDLSQLPLLTVKAIPTEEDVTTKQRLFDSQLLLTTREQYVTISNVDATAVNAAPSATVEASGIRAAVYPNPVTTGATVRVNAERTGVGTVAIVNALGQRVAELANGTITAGTSNYVVNGLAAGAYRVVVTINGVSSTAPFSVVR